MTLMTSTLVDVDDNCNNVGDSNCRITTVKTLQTVFGVQETTGFERLEKNCLIIIL